MAIQRVKRHYAESRGVVARSGVTAKRNRMPVAHDYQMLYPFAAVHALKTRCVAVFFF